MSGDLGVNSVFAFNLGTATTQFPAGQHSRDQHCNATGHFAPHWECYWRKTVFEKSVDTFLAGEADDGSPSRR